jgi:NADH dehydrogenase
MVEGDLCDPKTLHRPLEGVRQIVHLGALVRTADPAANQAVNADGTLNLLAAATAAGVERVVSLSSDSVLRSRLSPYAESKAIAEAAVLAWGAQEGRTSVVLRPPLILGPQSHHLQTLLKLSRLPALPLPRRTASRCPVFVEDVSNALLAALSIADSAIPDRPIDLPGATHLDFGALICAVATSQGRRGPALRRLPNAALRGLGRLAGDRVTEQLQGIEEEVHLDGRLATEILNWQPVSLEQMLRKSLS